MGVVGSSMLGIKGIRRSFPRSSSNCKQRKFLLAAPNLRCSNKLSPRNRNHTPFRNLPKPFLYDAHKNRRGPFGGLKACVVGKEEKCTTKSHILSLYLYPGGRRRKTPSLFFFTAHNPTHNTTKTEKQLGNPSSLCHKGGEI